MEVLYSLTFHIYLYIGVSGFDGDTNEFFGSTASSIVLWGDDFWELMDMVKQCSDNNISVNYWALPTYRYQSISMYAYVIVRLKHIAMEGKDWLNCFIVGFVISGISFICLDGMLTYRAIEYRLLMVSNHLTNCDIITILLGNSTHIIVINLILNTQLLIRTNSYSIFVHFTCFDLFERSWASSFHYTIFHIIQKDESAEVTGLSPAGLTAYLHTSQKVGFDLLQAAFAGDGEGHHHVLQSFLKYPAMHPLDGIDSDHTTSIVYGPETSQM
ncbi:hypothetical protein ACJX0J_034564, partial [Zea mays]